MGLFHGPMVLEGFGHAEIGGKSILGRRNEKERHGEEEWVLVDPRESKRGIWEAQLESSVRSWNALNYTLQILALHLEGTGSGKL